jgi:hypothetical protein
VYHDETNRTPRYLPDNNRDDSKPDDHTIYSRYPFCKYVPPSASPSSSTSSDEQFIDYFGIITIDKHAKNKADDYPPSQASSKRKPASEYFRELYTDKHITHQTDDSQLATEEHSDAGPELEDDPRLQRIIGGIVGESGDEDVSSDMERTKKRKSINESHTTAHEVAERFRQQQGDGTDPSESKVLW